MGYLPDTSRFRTPVVLVVILLIGMCFLGFTYWTEYNRGLSYQRKVAFLEGTISKMVKAGDEADGRENDFQRELKRQKERMQLMNNVIHQETIRLNQKLKENQDQYEQDMEAKDTLIKDKEALISNLKQTYMKMQQDMEGFQKNQSRLLEEFTVQSEKMEMLIRLKDKCYSQMKSISNRISSPSLSSDVAAAGGSPVPQDKGSRAAQPEVKAGAGRAEPPAPPPAEPSTPPSAVEIHIPPLKLVDRLKSLFSDTVKDSDTNSEAQKKIASEATVVKGDNNVPPVDDEDERPKDEEAKAAVEQKRPSQPLKVEPDLLKPSEKDEAKKEKPIDEEVKAAAEEKEPAQPLADETDVLKANEEEEAEKEDELRDGKVKAADEEKKPAQPLEDDPDLLQPSEKEEVKKKETL